MVPKTEEQWWDEYAAIRDDIMTYADFDLKVRVIAAHPAASGVVSKSLLEHYRANPEKSLEAVMDEFEAERDERLALILEFLWSDAPDSPAIYSWPSWGRFCDLCSASHLVLSEEGFEDEFVEEDYSEDEYVEEEAF